MKKLLIVGLAVLFIAPAASAVQYQCYSWEDCVGTILGSYGNLVDPMNVCGPQTGSQGPDLPPYTCPGAHSPERYLHVAESPHSGTPEAFIAWVINLNTDDVVYAHFYGYDITPGASPSLRIWGAETTTDDINNYLGSESGNLAYTAGTGWDMVAHTWTFINAHAGGALRISARLYSTPSTLDPARTDFWIDSVCVEAPDHATIIFPGDYSAVEDATWTSIKALYR